jgi:hypothetical protein
MRCYVRQELLLLYRVERSQLTDASTKRGQVGRRTTALLESLPDEGEASLLRVTIATRFRDLTLTNLFTGL